MADKSTTPHTGQGGHVESRQRHVPPAEQLDFGSERLPTDLPENPWDTPTGSGGVPPAERVAGDSPSDPSSEAGGDSDAS